MRIFPYLKIFRTFVLVLTKGWMEDFLQDYYYVTIDFQTKKMMKISIKNFGLFHIAILTKNCNGICSNLSDHSASVSKRKPIHFLSFFFLMRHLVRIQLNVQIVICKPHANQCSTGGAQYPFLQFEISWSPPALFLHKSICFLIIQSLY